MSGSATPQAVEYVRILPELVLSIFGMVVMVVDPLIDERRNQRTLGNIALLGSLAAIVATLYQSQFPGPGFWNMVNVDTFSVFFHFLVTTVTAVVILTSYEYMEVQQIRAGEYYGLILFGAVGMCLMSSAVELVLIFIALEISSISTYILAGFRRRAVISSEASVKYFLLGSFATAFFLYGIALMFGATGSTSISAISQVLRSGSIPVLAYAGIALMFVGLGFKVAAAPFHIWTPDVYEGAPSPVVGFMSTAPKAAVFAVLLRIMFQANAPGRLWLIWVTAALSAARSHTDHFSALADWNSDHRWIFREVLCLQRSASGEPGGIGNYRSAQQCRGSVLLLASDGCDVHARAARRSAASAGSDRIEGGINTYRVCDHLPGNSAGTCSRVRLALGDGTAASIITIFCLPTPLQPQYLPLKKLPSPAPKRRKSPGMRAQPETKTALQGT